MVPRVAVIGAGAAGAAAAWSAARRGARVTVLSAQAGSSSLGSGAVDLDYGAAPAPASAGLDADVLEFVTALGIWELGPCRIATRQGVVRATRGRELSLLNLQPLAGRRVAVADVERDDWDAPALAASLSDGAWSRRTKTEFVSVRVPGLRRGAERRIAAYDFALLHDHPERLAWFGDLLRKARVSADAWLLGPWLGTDISVAESLREQVGLPLGESSSPPGGAAGARFDRAVERLLDGASVERRSLRVERVERAGTEWRISGEHSELAADAVIVAVGGVAAGGIALAQDAERVTRGFRLAIDAPLQVVLDGDVAGEASSLFGPVFETSGFGALERVGVELTHEGLARSKNGAPLPSLSAAGDCIAGRPRSLLEAVRSGCAAIRAVLPGP